MDRFGKSLREKYKTDMKRFLGEFAVTPEMKSEFEALAVKKGVTMNPEQLAKDMPYIETRMKEQVARALWGNEGWYSVMRAEDNQFQKAVTLFPEAEKIARLN